MDTILYICLIPLALLLDKVFSELPTQYHPVAIMGLWATKVEKLARRLLLYIDKKNTHAINTKQIKKEHKSTQNNASNITNQEQSYMYSENKWILRFSGILAALVSVSPFILAPLFIIALINLSTFLAVEVREFLIFLVTLLCLYLCIAPHSLAKHALNVSKPLEKNDIIAARKAVSAIVGRSTKDLDSFGIARACVESVGENVTDSTLSSIFWASIGLILYSYAGGVFFVLLHRCFNTLDAMWGKRNEKYQYFGTFAARTDDVLNYLPARLSLLSIVIASYFTKKTMYKEALRVGYTYRYAHNSPNSAWSEAAFAGALGLKLGGPVSYESFSYKNVTHDNTVKNDLTTHNIAANSNIAQNSITNDNLAKNNIENGTISSDTAEKNNFSNDNIANADLIEKTLVINKLEVNYPYFGDGTLEANATHIRLAIKLMWNCVWVFSILSCIFIYILTF